MHNENWRFHNYLFKNNKGPWFLIGLIGDKFMLCMDTSTCDCPITFLKVYDQLNDEWQTCMIFLFVFAGQFLYSVRALEFLNDKCIWGIDNSM